MSLAEAGFRLKAATVRRGAGDFLADLMRAQRLPQVQLQALQDRRLTDLLRFAVDRTRFYPRWFAEHGVDPSSVRSVRDLHRLPVLDRTTVKTHALEFHSDEASPRTTRDALTGGSTGEPLRTQHDTRVPTLALSWRMYSWWGVQPWDNLARVGRWGFGPRDSLKNALSWWPTKQVYLDAGLMGPETMAEFLSTVQRIRPRLIEGYVGSMLELADYVEARGLSLPQPAAVATTAAPLPASARNRLESVFKAPVYDEYRGSEFGWMAGECREQNGLHIFADARLIEVVDEQGNPLPAGEIGDLVITDLTNRVFPLIRYRNGDRGSLLDHPCPCGVTLPLMAQPDGRTTDLLRLPSGRTLGHRLMGMFGSNPDSVRLFQIHQSADFSITVRVVKGDEAGAEANIESAVAALRSRMGDEVPVRLEYVDSLPFSRGKVKYVISEVPGPSV